MIFKVAKQHLVAVRLRHLMKLNDFIAEPFRAQPDIKLFGLLLSRGIDQTLGPKHTRLLFGGSRLAATAHPVELLTNKSLTLAVIAYRLLLLFRFLLQIA